LRRSSRVLPLLGLVVLGLGAMVPVSAQEIVHSYTEWAGAANPVLPELSPADPGETVTGGVLAFFTDRPNFQGTCPGLPLEDFSNTLVPANMALGCVPPGPLNSATNDNCFATGGLIAGFTLSSSIPTEDMVVLTPPFVGLTKVTVGPNTLTDNSEILFSPAVSAVGVEVVASGLNFSLNIDIFDAGDVLIGSTTSMASQPGVFWGVMSTVPIGRIAFSEGAGQGELYNNLEFGSCIPEEPQVIPTLGWQGMLALLVGLAAASIYLMRRRRIS